MNAPLSYRQKKQELKQAKASRTMFLQQLIYLREQHENNILSDEEYVSRKKDFLMGRSVESWISGYESRISSLEQQSLLPALALSWVVPVLLLIVVSLGFFVVPSFTGFFTYRNVSVSTDRVGLVFSDGGS
ncbi:MAG: hypothetical protein GXP63_05600, partial [DPANN group archaeon]|nr:hypothetical protein [DPANN group archaeon]